MRRAARRDDGEDEIVDALRAKGVYVKKVNAEGFADLVCWYKGRTLILEVKDGKKPPSKRQLTDAEQRFHDDWPGDNLHIVLSADDAIAKFDW
jgi:Holliday junction resolvase